LLSDLVEPRASLFGLGVHLLEVRWSFILYPLAVPAAFFEPARVLIVAQALALSIAVWPLWSLARVVAKLRVSAATAVALAYAVHPATQRLAVDDFHPVALAVPSLIGMAYFGATKRWLGYWFCVAFTLACRADLGLAVAMWGFVVLSDGQRRTGLWTLGLGSSYSLGLLLVLQPLIGQGPGSGRSTGYNGQTLGDLLLGSLRDPIESLGAILAQENLALVVALLAPVIFLPLLSLRYLAPALPLAGLYLLASAGQATPFAERGAMLLAFVMIATVHALKRLGTTGVDRVFLDVRLLSSLVAAAILLFLATAPTSPYGRPWDWGTKDATDLAVVEAVAQLGPEVPVRASPSALASLSSRFYLLYLPPDTAPAAVNMGFPDFTLAVLLVERELPRWTDDERTEFTERMARLGFELTYDNEGVLLYVR
jgi:uncharacterized membrane protein